MFLVVTGASGSGTSTLGRAVAAHFGIAHLDTDDYFWLPTEPPFTTKRDGDKRSSLILSDLRTKQRAIVSGSIVGWGAELENVFDFVVFLYLDAAIRVERLRKREIERFGKADPAFLEWAAQYDFGPSEGRSLAMHRAWLSARSCPVLELRGDLSVAELVATVVSNVQNRSIEATSHLRI